MTSPLPPIRCLWDGESFVPEKRFAIICDRRFTVGEVYPLVVEEARSAASHRHEFAWVKEAWNQLPEAIAAELPSPEHLRKRALIEAGWYHETLIDVGSNAAALRVRKFLLNDDDFAHVVVRGGYVVVRKAKSQSERSMNKGDFQTSKTALMEVISNWIGVKPEEIRQNVGRAA